MDQKILDWININIDYDFIIGFFPKEIDVKPDNIIDTYHAYDKSFLKYHIDICNAIWKLNPKDEIVFKWLAEYKKKLIDLNDKYPLPYINYSELNNNLSNAFSHLKSFMNGDSNEYKYFGFNDTFTILFETANKTEIHFYFISSYWSLTEEIRSNYVKSDFYKKAFDNKDFANDFNEIIYLNSRRIVEFVYFTTQYDIVEFIKIYSNDNFMIEYSISNNSNNNKSDQLNFNLSDDKAPYVEITFSHTLYKPFHVLKNYIKPPYKMVFHDKDNLHNFPFLYHDYKNTLNPVKDSESIFNKIKNYFSDNALTSNQSLILIYNLLPLINSYGQKQINSHPFNYVTSRSIVQDNVNHKYKAYYSELRKTINSINKTIPLLHQKLTSLISVLSPIRNTIDIVDKTTLENQSDSSQTTNNKSKKYSFQLNDYDTKHTALTDLHNSLINKDFIVSDDVYNFKKLFNNKPLNKKINWIGLPSELYYFIYYLSHEKLIKRKSIWILAPDLFELSTNPDYDLNRLKSLKKPVSADLIEQIINTQLNYTNSF